jgi:hypothetical protein
VILENIRLIKFDASFSFMNEKGAPIYEYAAALLFSPLGGTHSDSEVTEYNLERLSPLIEIRRQHLAESKSHGTTPLIVSNLCEGRAGVLINSYLWKL